MRIEWVTVCRYAERTESGMNMLGAGLDTTQVADVSTENPARITLFVGTSLLGPYHEIAASQTHQFQWVVLDPEMNEIGRNLFPVETRIADPENYHHGSEGRIAFPVYVIFDATQEGLHELQFTLDGATPPTALSYWIQRLDSE
jgi:hypothetical protein